MTATGFMDATYVCDTFENVKGQKSSQEKEDAIWNLMALTELATQNEGTARDALTLHYRFINDWCGKENAHLCFVRDALFQNKSVQAVMFYQNAAGLELIVVAEQADSSTYKFVSEVLVKYEDAFRRSGTYMLLTPEQVCPSDISSAWKQYKNKV